MFCLEEDNKIISRWLGCLPWQQIFRKTSTLSYYFYIIIKYVRYNNVEDLYISKTVQRHITGWTTLV
jgi:hypothetical protein